MLPLPVPPGTTLEIFLEKLFPEAHAARVPASVPRDPVTVVLSLGGAPGQASSATEDTPVRDLTLEVRGAALKVTRGQAAKRDLWIRAEGRVAEHFVADWARGGPLTPRWPAAEGSAPSLLTDPRILRRLQMVSGRIEVALGDFPLGRASLTLASGAAAKRPIEAGNADATLELTMATFDQVISGKLRPDEAIADGRFELRGKKMVALQFAFAVGPFFQPSPRA